MECRTLAPPIQRLPFRQLDTLLQEKLDQAFHQPNSKLISEEISKIAYQYSPIDLAHAVTLLPSHIRPIVYDNLIDLESQAIFIVHTDDATRMTILRHLKNKDIKILINEMAWDDVVLVLNSLSERRFKKILTLLEASQVARILKIKHYQNNTAGQLMTTDFFACSEELVIESVADLIKDTPETQFIKEIFVVTSGGILQGYVPLRHLIIHPPTLLLKEIMLPVAYKISPTASQEEVVDIAERYKLSSIPVVERDDLLIGVITHEDIIEAIGDITGETIAQMAGTEEHARGDRPTWKRLLSRIPWLMMTLFAGLINVGLISSFQEYEGKVLAFAIFFVPLITGLSGNVGIQCSTVLVRSMATGSLGRTSAAILKEIIIGISIGFFFGILSSLFIGKWDLFDVSNREVSSHIVGLIVGTGLSGACLMSTLLGTFFPFFFSKIGVDPAIASGPIVTAINDFVSIFIYFLIAIILKALLL